MITENLKQSRVTRLLESVLSEPIFMKCTVNSGSELLCTVISSSSHDSGK